MIIIEPQDEPLSAIVGGFLVVAISYLLIRFWNSPLGIWLARRSLRGGSTGSERGERYRKLVVYPGYAFMALGAWAILLGLFGLFTDG